MKEEKLRSAIKIFFREIGIFMLYGLVSFAMTALFYFAFCRINRPPVVSEETIKRAEEELEKINHGSGFCDLTDFAIASGHGNYKYDDDFILNLCPDLTEQRIRAMKGRAEEYSSYLFWGCLALSIFTRYSIRFYRWVYTPEYQSFVGVSKQLEITVLLFVMVSVILISFF